MDKITLFGQTNFRGANKKFGIKVDDRRRHMYIIGKTGMGKTTMLENMVISDMVNGHGVGVVDPHGDFAEKMLDYVPKERIKDVIYFNPSDSDFPIAFNPLEQVTNEMRPLIASSIMGVFKKIWPDVWSARMEYILNNALLALLEFSDSTILGVLRIFSDKDYRTRIVEQLKDPVIKGFWVNEYARYAQKFETEATAAIQNKIGQLVANPTVRNILGQPKSAMNLRKAMDEQKILIFNLSKGRIGEDNSALLGAMIITKIQLAAMSRVDLPENDRKDFFLYVDEFQNFATDSFANILSEARKYRLSLILAHQYIRQLVHDMNTRMRDAVFGNVGTLISFRVGAEDAEFLEKEFEPDFMATDILNLAKYNVYVKLMIDGVASRPFSAKTMDPISKPPTSYAQEIIEYTRKTYATPIAVVSAKIAGEFLQQGSGGGDQAGSDIRRPRPEYRPDRPITMGSMDGFRRESPSHQTSYGNKPTPEAGKPEVRRVDIRREIPITPIDRQENPRIPLKPKFENIPQAPAKQASLKELVPRPPDLIDESARDIKPLSSVKKSVDIEALKKAITESLKKKEG